MKKILFLFTIVIALSSCSDGYIGANEYDLQHMKNSKIVSAKNPRSCEYNGSIVIKDANGTYYTFRGETYLGGALLNTYQVGDTIK
jgi:hypothetical protein